MLSKLGQIDSAESTKYLTSAMKGYKVAVEDTAGIVDKLTAVDMEAAVTAGGIAEAMSMTANGARLAGVDMNKLIGIMTSTGEVSQAEMSKIGTAYKTMFARMSNVKLGKMEDDEGVDITTEINDVEKVLNKIGVPLRKSATEWNNFGDVLDKIGAKWNTLNGVQKSAIATGLGGVRQKEFMITLFENYDKALQYEETALESSGTAIKKYEDAYLGSIEAKSAAFKASFEKLSMSIINSGALKTLTDMGSATLDWLDGTDKIVPTFFRILGVVTAIGIVLKRNQIAMTLGKFREIGVALAPATKELSTFSYIAKGAGASLKAFFSTPLGAATLIAGAIFLISSGIKALDKTTAEAMDKFAKESSKYEENKTSLEGVNSELKTTKDRIAEINAIPLKTLAEQDELNNLEEKNKKLQIQYDLLLAQSKLLESNKAQAGAEVYSSLNKTGEGWGFGNLAPSGYSSTGKRLTDLTYLEKIGTPFSTGGADALPMALEGYKASQKEMESIADKDSKRYKKLQKDLSDYSSSIQEISAAYQAVLESYVKGTPQYIEAEKALSAVSVTLGTATTKSEKYSEVISKYSSAKTGLEELSAANKLNVESVSELVSKYPALKSELDSIGVSAEQLVTEFSTASDPIAEMEAGIDSLGESFKTFKGRLSDLEEIQKNSNKGYEFSYNEITKIKEEYPELIEYITRSANGWTIAKNSVNMFSTGVRFTAEEVAFLQKDHENLNATLDEATGLYYLNSDALGILGVSALQAKINYNQFQVDATKAAIDGARQRIDALKAETAALTTFMATSALVKQSGDTGTVLSSSEFWMMKRDGLASVSGYSNYDEYTAGRVSGISGSQMQSLQKAQKQLEEYQATLNDIGTNPTSGASAKKGDSAEELLRKQIQAQKDAFEKEKAVIDSQLARNLITQKEYADELLALNEKYFSDKTLYLEEYVKNEADIYKARQEGLKDAEKAISDLAKMTEDMIKKEKELEKDALEEKKDNLKEEMEKEEKALEKKKDNLKEYTDARKKALEDARTQDKYDKEVREKSKDIETIKSQLLGLSGDMSGAGMRKKKELEQSLKDLQDELGETVADRQYDSQIDAIDASYAAQEKALEAQVEKIKTTYETQEKEFEDRIKIIEMYLDSEGQITTDAYNRLNGLNSSFYNDLMEYNRQYGTGINNDITNQWKLATSALMEYGGTLSNIQGTYATISTSIGQATGYATGTSGLKRDSIIVGTHELLLNKTGSNAYQMMNAGSPIFTEQQTNALKALLSSPSSLLTKSVGGVGLNNASTIMSMVNSNNSQDIDLHYEFNISGTDPIGIESAITKLLPKIKDYTLSAINKDVQFSKGVRLTAANMA